jgi:hypothetical protein
MNHALVVEGLVQKDGHSAVHAELLREDIRLDY